MNSPLLVLGASIVLTFATIAFAAPDKQAYLAIADQVEKSLHDDDLNKWFPASIDEKRGGFMENYREDWSSGGRLGQRSIVYQSRLTWLASAAGERYPKDAERFLKISRHGVAELSAKMWDADNGGFFWSIEENGKPSTDHGAEKHSYGNGFGIYAAATSYRATHDAAALDLAKKAFTWFDTHAHDTTNGGYFEALDITGKPILDKPGKDAIGTNYGRKSMNTHIHLLEAFTALHEVWADETLKARLNEVFEICLTKIYDEPGIQHMFFEADWKPIPGPDSYGHDIETGYLLVEAAAAIGRDKDPKVWHAARSLVDHGIAVGYDQTHGGFYDSGTVDGKELVTQKVWWVEAEGLNVLLLMHEKYGSETSKYWDLFVRQWDFIARHQIDAKNGGWHAYIAADGTASPHRAKSDRWTEGYHQGRAMLNVSARLRKLAAE